MIQEWLRMVVATIGVSAAWGPTTLDAADVKFFELVERVVGSQRVLHLDALVLHSSLGVAGVDLRYEDDAAVVEVRLAPAGKDVSGGFVLDVPIRPETRRVLFGASRRQIWPAASH